MLLKLLHMLPAETAHDMTICALKYGLYPPKFFVPDTALHARVWGLDFPSPVGLSAGFDKNAEVYNAMLGLGMGFVEVGSITPKPQYGNPKPRLFRLPADGAIINRFGFNNKGMVSVLKNLQNRTKKGIVGVNLGKNKTTNDPIQDFVIGCEALAPYADYVVINVSSPNTPGLRDLQGGEDLAKILTAVCEKRNVVCGDTPPPVLVKIAPDLADEDIKNICDVVVTLGGDGIIVSNTTNARPSHMHPQDTLAETGGLSGRPLFKMSTEKLKTVFQYTGGQIPLIGVGGICDGYDAYEKIRAGASLVQLYSALVYGGIPLIARIHKELADAVRQDGFSHYTDAIGVDVT